MDYQAPPSLGFSRQEYWSGLPFPSPGDLSNPRIKPGSPILQADALPSEPPGKSRVHIRAGQLDHSWVSRFYNIQLVPGKLAIVSSHGGGQLEDSLYSIKEQPPGPMCNLNSQVSDLSLNHLCLSTGDFISPSCQKV